MAESEVILGTIDKWQMYGDKENSFFVVGIMKNAVINTEQVQYIDAQKKILHTKRGMYRLGKPFNSYSLANYRLARDKKMYDEPKNKIEKVD